LTLARNLDLPISMIILLLVVYRRLNYRGLRKSRIHADDSLALRLHGMGRVPDVSTTSRKVGKRHFEKLGAFGAELVFDGVSTLPAGRVALDVDGSVISTKRFGPRTSMSASTKKSAASAATIGCTAPLPGAYEHSASCMVPARYMTRAVPAPSLVPASSRFAPFPPGQRANAPPYTHLAGLI